MKTPWPHQPEIATQAFELLKKFGLAYLVMEERTGKSLTSLLAMEKYSDQVQDILIITKVKALEGWEETLLDFAYLLKKRYHLVNYHSAHKYTGKVDAAILDESHAYISGFPKRSKMWKTIHSKVFGVPILFSSATSHAQGTQLLFNQLAMSMYSPFRKFKDFYAFFREYAKRDKNGNLPIVRISAERQANDYTALMHDKVMEFVRPLMITKTRKELGFKQEPEDEKHYINLKQSTKDIYNSILDDLVLEFTIGDDDRDYTLVCDTSIKLRCSLHMLEGGTLKVNDEYLVLNNTEKVDYVLDKWGDTEDLVIMYHYKAELLKLQKYFKKAELLQADSYAEGVDLSGYRHLVIYSQSFSTAKYTQRRARQANKNREEEIKVHFLLVKKAVSEQVYTTVSVNKTNFVDSTYEREKL